MSSHPNDLTPIPDAALKTLRPAEAKPAVKPARRAVAATRIAAHRARSAVTTRLGDVRGACHHILNDRGWTDVRKKVAMTGRLASLEKIAARLAVAPAAALEGDLVEAPGEEVVVVTTVMDQA